MNRDKEVTTQGYEREERNQYLVLSIDINQLLHLVEMNAMTSERFGQIIFNSLRGDEISMMGLRNSLHFLKPIVIGGGLPSVVIFNRFGRPFNPMSVDASIPDYVADLPEFIDSLVQVLETMRVQLKDQESIDMKEHNSRLGGTGIHKSY